MPRSATTSPRGSATSLASPAPGASPGDARTQGVDVAGEASGSRRNWVQSTPTREAPHQGGPPRGRCGAGRARRSPRRGAQPRAARASSSSRTRSPGRPPPASARRSPAVMPRAPPSSAASERILATPASRSCRPGGVGVDELEVRLEQLRASVLRARDVERVGVDRADHHTPRRARVVATLSRRSPPASPMGPKRAWTLPPGSLGSVPRREDHHVALVALHVLEVAHEELITGRPGPIPLDAARKPACSAARASRRCSMSSACRRFMATTPTDGGGSSGEQLGDRSTTRSASRGSAARPTAPGPGPSATRRAPARRGVGTWRSDEAPE